MLYFKFQCKNVRTCLIMILYELYSTLRGHDVLVGNENYVGKRA
jgi:hypothetical protein